MVTSTVTKFSVPEEILVALISKGSKDEGIYKRITTNKLPVASVASWTKLQGELCHLELAPEDSLNEREFDNCDDDPHVPLCQCSPHQTSCLHHELDALADKLHFGTTWNPIAEPANFIVRC